MKTAADENGRPHQSAWRVASGGGERRKLAGWHRSGPRRQRAAWRPGGIGGRRRSASGQRAERAHRARARSGIGGGEEIEAAAKYIERGPGGHGRRPWPMWHPSAGGGGVAAAAGGGGRRRAWRRASGAIERRPAAAPAWWRPGERSSPAASSCGSQPYVCVAWQRPASQLAPSRDDDWQSDEMMIFVTIFVANLLACPTSIGIVKIPIFDVVTVLLTLLCSNDIVNDIVTSIIVK